MAISPTTDWSKIRYIMFVLFSTSALLASAVANGLTASGKTKRQLFRENLLPEKGGKIPDGAFDPERLNLNALNKNGFYSIDGYYLETRLVNRQKEHRVVPSDTMKLELPPDNKHVAPPGQSSLPRIIDTTYLVHYPVNYFITPTINKYSVLPQLPYNSLGVLRRFKYQNNYPKENVALKIFKEFAPSPLLQKLHEADA